MMNTVRKSENLLPFPVISAAANGDTTAMCAILKHYEGYIAKLCTRTLKDDAGNTYSYVDEEMRNRLQVRLITRTLAFSCRITFPAHAGACPLSTLPVMGYLSFRKSISAVDVLLQADKAYCSLTKKAAFGAQHNRQRVHSVCIEPVGGYAMTAFPLRGKPSENYLAVKQV